MVPGMTGAREMRESYDRRQDKEVLGSGSGATGAVRRETGMARLHRSHFMPGMKAASLS